MCDTLLNTVNPTTQLKILYIVDASDAFLDTVYSVVQANLVKGYIEEFTLPVAASDHGDGGVIILDEINQTAVE